MLVFWLSILHYYTTFTGFLAYFFLSVKKIKVSHVDFITICGILCLFVVHFAMKDPYAVVIDFRFYWGWLVFYFIFKVLR